MKRIHFHGPTDFLAVDGKTIKRGESDVVSDAAADRLSAWDEVEVTVTDEPAKNGGKK